MKNESKQIKNRKLPALPLLTYYSLITDKNPGAAVRHTVLIISIPFSCYFCPLSRKLLKTTTRDDQRDNAARIPGMPGRDTHRHCTKLRKLRL